MVYFYFFLLGYCTSFGTGIVVRLRSTSKFYTRGRCATNMNPLLIDRDQVFPKPARQSVSQPASQPSVCVCVRAQIHVRMHARTHANLGAENNQVVEEEWAAAAGEEAKTTLRERKREGRSDCTSPCESRSEGKSIVLKHLVELNGFPHFITKLWEGEEGWC